MRSVEKITLRLFWVFMLLCAGSGLIGLWFEHYIPEWAFKFIPTFFIIGFANFLIWAPLTVHRFLEVLKK